VIVRRPSDFIEPSLASKVARPPSEPSWRGHHHQPAALQTLQRIEIRQGFHHGC
jgi:hypothetical protein